jgi:peptidoglycan/LPS O-acetylase OafA/YrhL
MKQGSDNLDLLRSAAVLMVLGFHLCLLGGLNPTRTTNLEPIGHFGVLIFFVHTSLVLMLSMRRTGLLGAPLFWAFYIRRFFRIYPLSIAVVLLMVGFHVPSRGWGIAVFSPVTYRQLISNLALTMNLTRSPYVLIPLWSLPYEIQMYVVLPALYLFFRRHSSFRVLAFGWAVSAVAGWGVPHLNDRIDFVRFAPCYLGSIITVHIKKNYQPYLPAWVFPLGIAALLVAYVWLDRSDGGWVPCLILALLIPACREIKARAVTAVCRRVARYSFGIYLGHAPIMWLAFKAIHVHLAVQICLFTMLIILVPVAMFHLLEAPMVRMGNRLALKWSPAGR